MVNVVGHQIEGSLSSSFGEDREQRAMSSHDEKAKEHMEQVVIPVVECGTEYKSLAQNSESTAAVICFDDRQKEARCIKRGDSVVRDEFGNLYSSQSQTPKGQLANFSARVVDFPNSGIVHDDATFYSTLGPAGKNVNVVDMESGLPLQATSSSSPLINVSTPIVSEPRSPSDSIVHTRPLVDPNPSSVHFHNLPIYTSDPNLSNESLSVEKANVLIDLGLSTIFNRLSLKRKFDSSWDNQYRAKLSKFSSFHEDSGESNDRGLSSQGSFNCPPPV